MFKFFAKEMTVEMFQFWPFFIFESREMTGIFHGAERFDFVPVATFANPVAVLSQHSYIKSDIVSDNAVRFFYIVEKILDITIDVIIGFQHLIADAVYSLRKEINLGRDIDILIDSRFFMKFLPIPDSVNPCKLNNLISRGEPGRFCIDKEKSDSFVFFRCSFFSYRFFLGWCRLRFYFCNHGISMI